jgi:hypothetical protein
MQLRNHFIQTVKRTAKELAQVASLERLRKRIIEPSVIDSSSSDEEYMNELNEAQDNNISEADVLENIENENLQGENNEQDMIEALYLSDYEDDDIIFEHEVDLEDNALEDSDNEDVDMICEHEVDLEDNALEDSDNEDDINENHFETEEQKANYVKENLREWATYDGIISKKKLDNLLLILNPVFPTLPKSYKTLLRTPKNLEILELPDGSTFWYKGIVRNLDTMLLGEYLEKYGNITIDINMDGLPVTKSSRIKFWPQLGRLVHTDNEPFLIGLYVGEWDPIDVHSYLHDFVTEVEYLSEHGYVRNCIRYPFKLKNFILDAPARSLVKCCVGHNGYGACEKCTVVGEYIDDRMTFLHLDAALRTDQSFRNQDDQLHHTGVTILLRIANMVSQFRLDPFHLVWHGAFRRLFSTWMEWNGPWKLSRSDKTTASNLLMFLADFCPSDFNRPPRPLDYWKMYKGTEERRLCLYDGILVFKHILKEDVYKHYLLFQTAMYILCSPVLVQTMCDYAHELLLIFIRHSAVLYGSKFVVYNIHSLCHLSQECKDHGSLDNFSAFVFENFLKSLKSSLKSCYKPLQQAAYRDLERTKQVPVKLSGGRKILFLSQMYINPEEQINGSHFRCLSIGNVKLKIGHKDSCFRTFEGNIFVLVNIIKRGNSVLLIGNKFHKIEDSFTYPLPSSTLGIVKVSHLDDVRHIISVENVQAKCWLMPDDQQFFLCIPLLHTMPLL